MTTLSQVNKALAAELPGIRLVKGNGYYYVTSNDDNLLEQICGLYTTSIGVCHISQQTVEQWIADVKYILSDSHRFGLDQCPVVIKS